jgi:hypothetical protein
MIKINSLWIGPLSTLERLCMASHLKHGHEYHLWVYEPLEAPEGVILEDANEILPKSEIFCYSGPKEEGGGSVSAFSNLFRYKLLSERQEWWCDTDVVCLRPFEFDYAVATEELPRGAVSPTTCVIRVPKDVALFCYEVACAKDLTNLRWGEIGPELYGKCAEVYGLSYRKTPATFCPIHWWDIGKLFLPTEITEESYAVHLWNEVWRRDGLDKDGAYRSGCLYERLKGKYLKNAILQAL